MAVIMADTIPGMIPGTDMDGVILIIPTTHITRTIHTTAEAIMEDTTVIIITENKTIPAVRAEVQML